MRKNEIHFVVPEVITAFGAVSRPGEVGFLTGFDKNNLIAFPGGRRDEGETDLFNHTFGREAYEEVGATIDKTKFGQPAYKGNLVLAHSRAVVFCTDTITEQHVLKPLEHARKGGKVKLRIVYRMLDISPRTPKVAWSSKELKEIFYRRVDENEPRMRESVRIILELGKLMPPNWMKPDRYNPAAPVKFGMGHLESKLNGLQIDPSSLPWFGRTRRHTDEHVASPQTFS